MTYSLVSHVPEHLFCLRGSVASDISVSHLKTGHFAFLSTSVVRDLWGRSSFYCTYVQHRLVFGFPGPGLPDALRALARMCFHHSPALLAGLGHSGVVAC